MARFIRCGELTSMNGAGFEVPCFLKLKDGIVRGDLKVTEDIVKAGKFNFPVEIKEVTGSFYCYDNNLTSLKGAPKEVGGNFFCGYNNNITSLEGCPKKVGGDFNCGGNAREFTEEEVRAVCDVKGGIYIKLLSQTRRIWSTYAP